MKKKLLLNPADDTFIMCSFFPVGLEDYVNFFRGYFCNFVYLKWKFPHSDDKTASSSISYFENGKLVQEKKLPTLTSKSKKLYFLRLPFNYLQYFIQSFRLTKRKNGGQRIFFGINYYCAFCGIVLKKLGFVDVVIYRVMDFFPLPPSGFYRFLNRIFYQFDKFCLKNSDSVWFTTEGHIVGREKYGYFDRHKADYEIIPLGAKKEKIIFNQKSANSIVYCGVVSRYHQLDLAFEAIKKVLDFNKKISFNLIGSGPDIEYYKKQARSLGINASVKFWGYMKEDGKFAKIMSESALGIALYKDEENFMKYTEPAKVKYYLNFGVPAIISKVPQIAFELDRRKISFAVDNDAGQIAEVIMGYLSDRKKQQLYKKNIREFLGEIDVDNMLDKKLNNTFKIKKN